jgi:hypothetical protein
MEEGGKEEGDGRREAKENNALSLHSPLTAPYHAPLIHPYCHIATECAGVLPPGETDFQTGETGGGF